jgi:hypothetical protein
VDDDSIEGREVPFGDPAGEEIILGNLRFLDVVAGKCDEKCRHCGWPLQASREPKYSDVRLGFICATCNDLRCALLNTNPLLKNGLYWRIIQNTWEEEEKKRIEDYRRKRRNLGMDDGGGPSGFA